MLMILITVFFWIATFICLAIKFKEKINPIIFIFHYFYGMLFFSQLSLTGIPAPNETTVFYFLTAYVPALIGVYLCKVRFLFNDDPIQANSRQILYFVLIFAFLPLTYVFYKNFYLISNGYEHFVQATRFERDTISVA